jgi:hypothetical protein
VPEPRSTIGFGFAGIGGLGGGGHERDNIRGLGSLRTVQLGKHTQRVQLRLSERTMRLSGFFVATPPVATLPIRVTMMEDGRAIIAAITR